MSIIFDLPSGPIVAHPMWDEYEKGITDAGPYVKCTYVVDWADADAFANGVMSSVVLSGGAGGSADYFPPSVAPESPNLRATAVGIKGVGESDPDGGIPAFRAAACAITYGVLTWDATAPADDPTQVTMLPNEIGEPYVYQEQSVEFSEELIPLPIGVTKFATSPQLVLDQPPAINVARATIRIVRKFVPSLRWELISGLLNRCNNATLFGKESGTIRFANAAVGVQFTSDGKKTCEETLIFEWREKMWGSYPRPDTGDFDLVGVGGVSPFLLADLHQLLRR